MRLTLLLMILTTAAISSEAQFKIAGKYYAFIKKDSLLVSSNCKDKCIALEKSKSIKSKVTQKKQKFASSIGSYACTEILKGQALLGTKKNKDMVGVCIFKEDSSMVDLNSLTTYINSL
jgi:hypothetical protein